MSTDKSVKDKPQPIHIFVDGEKEDTTESSLTAAQIIALFTTRDPTQTYLVRIHGNERESYEGRADVPIELQNGMRFQTVSLGPTPVSDGAHAAVGSAFFIEGLRELGYRPVTLPGRPEHVVFDYVVETGSKKAMTVRLGFVIPPDFPATTPTGPYVSPRVFPIKTDGLHPHGAIHATQALPFEMEAGGEWEYWSRPAHDWQARRKTVAGYLSHIWHLWDTQ